jgi:hypothetical protein
MLALGVKRAHGIDESFSLFTDPWKKKCSQSVFSSGDSTISEDGLISFKAIPQAMK